ncbi:MAG: hypothetical protein WBF71_02095, partial [Microthrixaceae bacterium]
MNSDTGSGTQTPAQATDGSVENHGETTEEDLLASYVAWDLDTLLDGSDVDDLMDQSEEMIGQLEGLRGKVADLDSAALAAAMTKLADLQEVQGRVGYYAMLRFSENTADPERGALM